MRANKGDVVRVGWGGGAEAKEQEVPRSRQAAGVGAEAPARWGWETRGGGGSQARGEDCKTVRGSETRPVTCPLFSNLANRCKDRARPRGRAPRSSEPSTAAPCRRPALTCSAPLRAQPAPGAASARPPVARTPGKHPGPRLRTERPRRAEGSTEPAPRAIALRLRPEPAPTAAACARDPQLPPRRSRSRGRPSRARFHGPRNTLLSLLPPWKQCYSASFLEDAS